MDSRGPPPVSSGLITDYSFPESFWDLLAVCNSRTLFHSALSVGGSWPFLLNHWDQVQDLFRTTINIAVYQRSKVYVLMHLRCNPVKVIIHDILRAIWKDTLFSMIYDMSMLLSLAKNPLQLAFSNAWFFTNVPWIWTAITDQTRPTTAFSKL